MAEEIFFDETDEVNVSDSIPEWKQKILDIDRKTNRPINPTEANMKDSYFEHNEVGVKHPINQSLVKITDEGMIDLFADDQLGIRIDPVTKSVNIFGDLVNIFSKNINFRTNPNGLIWNGYYFNPELYYEDEDERRQMVTGTKEYYHYTHEPEPELKWHRDSWGIRPMIGSTTRLRYSKGMVKIMEDLGLPTYPNV